MSTSIDEQKETNSALAVPVIAGPLTATKEHGGEVRVEQLGNAGNNTHTSHGGAHGEHQIEGEGVPKDLKKPSRTVVLGAVGAFVVLLIALFFIGLVPDLYRAHEARADAQAVANESPIVSTTRPVQSVTGHDIRLPCDVKAYSDTSLYPRANGYLKKWYVDINDKVKEGQLLAEISTPDVDAQLNQSKASLEQAKAMVETAQSNLDLMTVTLKRYEESNKNQPGSVTQEDLDTHRSQRDQAAAAVKQAAANVGSSQADVERETVLQGFEKIYAPFSGVVTFRGYDNGALLNPSNMGMGQQIYTIQQTDPLRVFASVPQAYASEITFGQPAFLTVRNFNNEFKGTVTRSTGSIDMNTRTMSFEIDFPNPQGVLYAGTYGQIRLPVKEDHPVLLIPTSSLVFDASGTRVATVEDNKAKFKKIAVGRDLGTQLEITEGLTVDDVVISNPGERLTDGVEVQVAKPKGAPADSKPEKVASKD